MYNLDDSQFVVDDKDNRLTFYVISKGFGILLLE